MIGYEVVIIGGVHHNTLGVIRSLGEYGEHSIPADRLYIILVGKHIHRKNIISASKYVVEKNVNVLDEYGEIINCLLEHAKDEKERVIICCSDEAAEIIISHKDILKDKYHLPTLEEDVAELMRKDKQDEIAIACGLSVPKSLVINKQDAFEWNCYPCIVKPIKSSVGGGKQDICICANKKELDKTILSEKAELLQIQEFVSKQMEFQLIGCSLDRGKIIIIPGYTRIVRQPKNTNTGYLEYIPMDRDLFNMKSVETLVKTIGYSGLFSIEFIRDPAGKDYFLEINMRNDGNAFCVKSAGVNLPFIWCHYNCNGALPEVPTTIPRSVWFIPDLKDLKYAYKQIGPIRWIKDFITADSHAIFDRKDIAPFFFEILRVVRSFFEKKQQIKRPGKRGEE